MLHLYYKRTLQGDSYMVVIVGIIVAYIIFVLLIAKFCDINTYPKEDDNNTSV
jgi:phosphotransferase system  glucose/maltose/N-acetylglucosamine-specific IIC component